MRQPPLTGVRVLDLTMMWAGPYATQLLAEMGAEVVKVESPRAWDNIRTLIPQDPSIDDPWNSSYYFAEYNHDKKSLTLDLATDSGRDLLLRLLAHCDVLVENYRADVMDKLGLTDEVLLAANPRLIVMHMAGFGRSGPDRHNVGFGPIIEMMSGLMSLSGYGEDGVPYKTGISYGDPVAGLTAVGGVAMALLRRHRSGRGAVIDLAQRETMAKLAGEAFVAASRGDDPIHVGNRSARWAPQGCYRVRGDDQWIVLSCPTDDEWRSVAAVIGRDDLAAIALDERRSRHDELDAAISAWAAPLDGLTAVEVLQEHGVPAGRVLDVRTVKTDPHLWSRGFWVRIPNPKMHPYRQHGVAWRFAEANGVMARHAPLFGEHNEAILGGLLGLDGAELDRLREAGVIAEAPVNPGVG